MKPLASVALLGIGVLLAPAVAAQSVERVLDRVAAYVASYERELGILIADERYLQEAFVQGPPGFSLSRRGGNAGSSVAQYSNFRRFQLDTR